MPTKINKIHLDQILIKYTIMNRLKKHLKGYISNLKIKKSLINYRDSKVMKNLDKIL